MPEQAQITDATTPAIANPKFNFLIIFHS